MKKNLLIGLGATLLLALGGCGTANSSSAKSDDSKTIGVLQLVQHNSLDATYKGFKEGLAENGYKEGDNLTINYQNAQNNGFADLNSGIGTIVIGLASIIIAEVLFRNQPLLLRLLTIILGAVIYRFILALVFELNVQPSDSKLASALVLVICLSFPQIQQKLKLPKRTKAKGGSIND